ncbi:MAG: coproporphyrinogen dehydrogenase HemZ [Ruminococcaceae bacterium]|nr:coproporphyrinogen dehydrogenase HemZ [Oscillospiraceae bacterium]
MKLRLVGHEDRFAIEQLQLALFPAEPMEPVDAPFTDGGAVSTLHRGKTWLTAVTEITLGGKRVRKVRRMKASAETVRLRRQLLQQCYYFAALEHLPAPPAWGALAGVRPTKLTTRHLLEGGTLASAGKMMKDTYFVSGERIDLCLDCSVATVEAQSLLEKRDISVYIGIPFCPTRCAYCSFISASASGAGALLEPYLLALLEEIKAVGEMLASSGCSVRTLYIGGGTPTTLSAQQLRRLMAAVNEHFDLSRCLEYTVEAGRPDTLSPEKLQTIYDLGARRVSINPQTMDNHVLALCGRAHKAEEIPAAFQMARDAGFQEINMDLIAGLPGDTPEGFQASLEAVAAMGPENITVHTLALKKAAALYQNPEQLPTDEEVARMVEFSNSYLRRLGYVPYYLYRQKYMSGSFENVGWCKPGSACLYNIYMMEELHSIIALGGGAMSKVNLPGGKLERFPNPKYPQQYLERPQAVLQEKQELFALLQKSLDLP